MKIKKKIMMVMLMLVVTMLMMMLMMTTTMTILTDGVICAYASGGYNGAQKYQGETIQGIRGPLIPYFRLQAHPPKS